MARGSKKKYTSKQKRKAHDIEKGYKKRGVSSKEAERRAWATVNKESGGGKKSGSGRGKKSNKSSSRKGGRAAHEKGTAHEWTPDEARNAGRKGGQISRGGRGRLVVPAAGDVNTVSGVSASGAEPRRAD